MSDTIQAYAPNLETLELRFLRLPDSINDSTMPQIMADLEQLLEPGVGVMLDFTSTTAVDLACLKAFEFAADLAHERASSLGHMGESETLKPILSLSKFFKFKDNKVTA